MGVERSFLLALKASAGGTVSESILFRKRGETGEFQSLLTLGLGQLRATALFDSLGRCLTKWQCRAGIELPQPCVQPPS